MSNKKRWMVWVLPLIFLGLILGVAWLKDPDLWRSSGAVFKMAEEAAARGDLPGALNPARKAWSREPENSGYGTFLAWVYLEGGQPQAALEVSHQVWSRDAAAVGALKIQALALDLLGERQKALELLARHLKERPEDTEILKSAAEIATRLAEDHPLAVTYYQRLYEIAPDPLVRRPLVGLLLSLNRFKEAIPLQEEEVAQFPEDQEALHQLALLTGSGITRRPRKSISGCWSGPPRTPPCAWRRPRVRKRPSRRIKPWPITSGSTVITRGKRNTPWPWPASGHRKATMPKPPGSWPP